jgi:hypothetical protein
MMEVPLSSPVPVSLYPTYSVFSLLTGFVFTAAFFVYQMRGSSPGVTRYLAIEMLIALVASVFLGFGILFTMLSFDLYV